MSKKKRKLSKNVYEESYKTKDKGGAKRQLALDFSKMEKDPVFYKPKKGTNKINIIPYEIKTKNHPLVHSGKCEVGDLAYMLDLYIHRRIGINNTDIVCLGKNYGKACPLCEEFFKLREEGKKEESTAYSASRRVFYNIIALETEEEGLQVFNASHAFFERELIEEARECANGEDIVPFADPEDGKVIRFRAVEESFNGNPYFKYKSFTFEDREEEIEDLLIDEAISFDELIVLHNYEEIQKIMYGEDLEDKDLEFEEDEDNSELEGEELEREEKSKKKKNEKSKCPAGYTFGEDCDKYKECDECELWDECVEGR